MNIKKYILILTAITIMVVSLFSNYINPISVNNDNCVPTKFKSENSNCFIFNDVDTPNTTGVTYFNNINTG